MSWILANLGKEYKGFISNITQSFRKDLKVYDFDTLTLVILDEAKWYKHKNYANIITKPNQNQNKPRKGQKKNRALKNS